LSITGGVNATAIGAGQVTLTATVATTANYLDDIAQEKFGLISLGISSGVVDAYPVRIEWSDFAWISLAVVTVTLLASWRPAWIAAQVDPKKEL
jgi:lipoprotein-releasing system permease protein